MRAKRRVRNRPNSSTEAMRLPYRPRRRAYSGILTAALLALGSISPASASENAEVEIVYLSVPGQDRAIAGARLGLADNNGTGRFLGQSFRLREVTIPAEKIEIDPAWSLVAAELPSRLRVMRADRPELRQATVLDVESTDDALRQESCRANLLHILPSRAMLADALMQYLVAKNWRRIMLLAGREPADSLYAEAVRRAAKKFRVSVVADRVWSFNPAAQRADTGHFQINSEVAEATRGEDYDVLVVADEAGSFGGQLGYRSEKPRPVVGTQGLTPTAWALGFDEDGRAHLPNRVRRDTGQ